MRNSHYLGGALEGKNTWWRYILVLLLTFIATQIGSIPLILVVQNLQETNPELSSRFAANPADFYILPIPAYQVTILIMLPFAFGFFSLLHLAKIIQQKSFISLVSPLGRFRWNRFFYSATVWAAISVALEFINYLFYPENYTFHFDWTNLIVFAIIGMLLIPLQASFEELLFRGYLMQGFSILTRTAWIPLLVTSIGFGVLHGVNPEVEAFGMGLTMPFYIGMGLLMGLVTLLDDGLEFAMGAHTANNFLGVVFISSPESAIKANALVMNNAVDPAMGLVYWSIAAFVFLILIHRKFHLKSWKTLLEPIHAAEV